MSRISDEELRRLIADAYSQPWTFGESVSPDGQEWWGCGVTNADGHEFAWLETDPETDIPTAQLIALAPALAAEVLQLREEVAGALAYTESIGSAGERYFDSFGDFKPRTPGTFRWQMLWEAMLSAALSTPSPVVAKEGRDA